VTTFPNYKQTFQVSFQTQAEIESNSGILLCPLFGFHWKRSNLVPRVCLFAGYVVAWLWGNRIEIVIWLANTIINVAYILMQFFARIRRGHTRRDNYQCLSDLECEIKKYKCKDIILIVWKSIGTLGIYLQNGMVFWMTFYRSTIWVYCMWKRQQVEYLFHDNHERIG
jgi:hypothetical protein